MRRNITILLVALIAGIAAFFFIRTEKTRGPQKVLLDTMPELTWVKSELRLSDVQFAKVSELHTAYRPNCMDMCRRIAAAHEKVEDLIRRDPQLTPELESAIRDHAAIHAECQQAMLKHIFQTAAVMDPEQGKLYLKEVLPFALDFSHSESGELHGR